MKSKTERLLNELVKLHPKYIDLSLNRLNILLKKLGNPHFNLPKTIHIAGTNGKGSIQSFIRNIIVSNGYTCDSYISPHLSKFNERIILNNKEVSTKKLYNTLKFVKKVNDNSPITFFEITTAAAFLLFKESNSDFLILETGLGGRLDATNIIPKKMCGIITPISFDHEEFLGRTIKKITNEKLGIIKNYDFCLISKQNKEVNNIISKKLFKHKNIYFYDNAFNIKKIEGNKFQFKFNNRKILINKIKLRGLHQIYNASVALAFAEIMHQKKFNINFNKINKVIKNTFWPGRLEILKYNNKKIILDGSHNIEGAKKLKDFLKESKIKPEVVFGMLNNKKISNFLKIIKDQIKNILAVNIPEEKNSFLTNEIKEYCSLISLECLEQKNLNDVMKYIDASNHKYFLVTGSLYLVGKIRNKFL